MAGLPLLLTYERVAEELGYTSNASVSKLVREKKLAVVGRGRGRRIPRQSLLDYIDQITRGAS